MITVYRKEGMTKERQEIELRGLSTDEKVTEVDGYEVENGTVFIEIDTGKLFMYDTDNDEWKEI